MAMIGCPECKKQISDSAESCPHCGFKLSPEIVADIKKKNEAAQKGCGIGCLAIIVIGFIGYLLSPSDSSSSSSTPSEPPKTPEQIHKESIEKCFSAWDGSNPSLESIIKNSMNDPKSYEHVETVYWDQKDHLVVRTTFRGKNAFGGVVKNWAKAKVGLNCQVTEIIEQGQ